jgi:hypothetical protein
LVQRADLYRSSCACRVSGLDSGKKEPAFIPVYFFIALVLFAVRNEFSFSQDAILFLPPVIFPGAVE